MKLQDAHVGAERFLDVAGGEAESRVILLLHEGQAVVADTPNPALISANARDDSSRSAAAFVAISRSRGSMRSMPS